jgi:hypothetical protein
MKRNVLGLLTVVGMVATGGCSSSSSTPKDAAVNRDVAMGGTGGTAGTGGSAGGADGAAAGRDGGTDAPDAAPVLRCGPFADGGMPTTPPDAGASPMASFFVSSQGNMTGNLGGLAGADMRCQTMAAAVGLGAKTWHAYLSVEHDATNNNLPRNARDRIGTGPWYNVKGVLIAQDLAALHARAGDAALFLDENGNMINGNWTGSPQMTMMGVLPDHDILTGTTAEGAVDVGNTCADWTSAMPMPDAGVMTDAGPTDAGGPDGGPTFLARVGHSDGLGQNCAVGTPPNSGGSSWNSAHLNRGCNDTRPAGGNGRIYCFAVTP